MCQDEGEDDSDLSDYGDETDGKKDALAEPCFMLIGEIFELRGSEYNNTLLRWLTVTRNVCSQTVTLWNATDLWSQDSVTDVSLAVVHKTLVHNTQQILVHRVTLLYEIIVWKI